MENNWVHFSDGERGNGTVCGTVVHGLMVTERLLDPGVDCPGCLEFKKEEIAEEREAERNLTEWLRRRTE